MIDARPAGKRSGMRLLHTALIIMVSRLLYLAVSIGMQTWTYGLGFFFSKTWWILDM